MHIITNLLLPMYVLVNHNVILNISYICIRTYAGLQMHKCISKMNKNDKGSRIAIKSKETSS